MVFGVKVSRHAAVYFAILSHTASEWNTLQLAIQGIAPLVVGTNQFLFVAMTFSAKSHAAVRANVFNHMNLPLLCAGHDDGTFTHNGAFEVARIGNFSFKTDITPMRFVEKALEFFFVTVLARIDSERDAAGA